MENTQNTNEYAFSLIIDEMDGLLSSEGKLDLKNWVAADPENEKIYREFYMLNNRLEMLSAQNGLNADESWLILEGKLEAEPLSTSTPLLKRWLPVAAVLIALLGTTFYFTIYTASFTVKTAANEQKSIALPDGSSLVLSGNTTLSYHKYLFKNSRKITLLNGEAFFKVKHDAGSPFVVDLGKIQLTDIGTSFNIIRSNDEVAVVVASGKVAMENPATKERLLLSPGIRGTYTAGLRSITRAVNNDMNYKAWADKKLTFNHTPLTEVIRTFQKVYGYPVHLENSSLGERTLTAKLSYHSADSALAVISESMRLTTRKQGGQFYLDAQN